MSEHKLRISHTENGRVIFVFDGKLAFDGGIPWEQADEIARQATRAARLAEEICKANQIIMDNALLHRSGVLPGIGLSDHPKIKDESIKEALHNRDLRRYLPYQKKNVGNGIGNIKSRGAVGAPSLTKRSN